VLRNTSTARASTTAAKNWDSLTVEARRQAAAGSWFVKVLSQNMQIPQQLQSMAVFFCPANQSHGPSWVPLETSPVSKARGFIVACRWRQVPTDAL